MSGSAHLEFVLNILVSLLIVLPPGEQGPTRTNDCKVGTQTARDCGWILYPTAWKVRDRTVSAPRRRPDTLDPDTDRSFPNGEDHNRSLRKETIRADLVRRLRNVCAHLSDEDFSHLIDMMVDRQIRSERRKFFG